MNSLSVAPPSSTAGKLSEPIDRARFPRVAGYLERLPQGASSYPECKASVAIFREFLDAKPIEPALLPALAPSVAKIIESKLPVSAFVEEAKAMAVLLAVADAHRMSDAEFVEFNHQMNLKLLGGRFFKVLMSMSSPSLLMSGASLRWNSLHKGTQWNVEKQPGGVRGILRFPAKLYDPLLLRCFGTAFQAVTELSNAKAVSCEIVESNDTQAVYRMAWS